MMKGTWGLVARHFKSRANSLTREVPAITTMVSLAASVDQYMYDGEAVKLALAALYQVPPNQIRIAVTGGSLQLTVTLTVTAAEGLTIDDLETRPPLCRRQTSPRHSACP